MNDIIIQLIGFLGYGFLAFSYSRKEKKQILIVQIFSAILFAIHYYLLEGLTGSIVNIISVIVLTCFYIFEKKKLSVVWKLVIIILSSIIICICTYDKFFSMFPIFANIFLLSGFLLTKENLIRAMGIICNACWIIYAVVYHSYSGIICETLTIIVTIGTIIKFANKKTKNI